MNESPERKAWNALAMEAAEFYAAHGHENMNAADRSTYEGLISAINMAADEHDRVRDQEDLGSG